MLDRQLSRPLIFVAMLLVAALVVRAWRAKSSTGVALDAVAPGGASSIVVPAQIAEDEGLPLTVKVQRVGDARTIAVSHDRGTLQLKLGDVTSKSIAFGKGSISAVDRTSGAAMLESIASWLKQPLPPSARSGTLAPAQIQTVRLSVATADKPETWKLFLNDGEESVEIYFNLWESQGRALLLEKDEEYRAGIVRFLARTLRDGEPPRRTKSIDPNVARDESLLGPLHEIPESARAVALRWRGHDLLGTVRNEASSALLTWTDLAIAPRTLATIPGNVESLAVQPGDKLIAVIASVPHDPDFISSNDPKGLMLVDVASGAVSTLVAATAPERLDDATLLWSPDGKQVVVRALHDGKPQPQRFPRVIDAKTGKVVADDLSATFATPESWETAGIVLVEFDPLAKRTKRSLWRIGGTDPTPIAMDAPWTSPDGKYRVRRKGAALMIAEGKETRTYTPKVSTDLDVMVTLDEAPRWVSPHAIAFRAEDWLLFDLQTHTLRVATDRRDVRLASVSPDGQTFVFEDGDRQLWSGRVIEGGGK